VDYSGDWKLDVGASELMRSPAVTAGTLKVEMNGPGVHFSRRFVGQDSSAIASEVICKTDGEGCICNRRSEDSYQKTFLNWVGKGQETELVIDIGEGRRGTINVSYYGPVALSVVTISYEPNQLLGVWAEEKWMVSEDGKTLTVRRSITKGMDYLSNIRETELWRREK
jgi:hypothetical protein